jgi:hypothetical protein
LIRKLAGHQILSGFFGKHNVPLLGVELAMKAQRGSRGIVLFYL